MAKIYFNIITLFPQFFASPLQTSLLAKSQEKDIVEINLHDLRDFGIGKHKQVDDKPFGGGPGMVLRVDVLKKSLDTVKGSTLAIKGREKPHVILLDPSGDKFNQDKAIKLSKVKQIILICGHYEGVDERFKQYVDEEISIGDYVLNGGEVAALVVVESVSRLVPGFLGKAASAENESFVQSIQKGKNVRLSRKRRILFICGHYEGVDERFKQYVDEEISIGDYILNGGEVAALVLIESVARLIPGFLGKAASTESESFAPSIQNGKNVRLLDYPSYTRPENYEGEEVPKILLSGNHKEIEQWRKSKAIEKTKKVRPDLINIYTSK